MDKASAARLSEARGETVRIRHLGIILRVHRRQEYLRRIVRQIKQLCRRGGPTVSLLISADRPTTKVIDELDYLHDKFGSDIAVYYRAAPGAIVSPSGLRWMTVLKQQYEQLKTLAPTIDAAMLWDDDALFSPGAVRELRGHLRCLEHDRVEVQSLFLWDHPRQFNAAFPAHWSACLFRVYPGDEYPTDFEVHCPEFCAFSPRVTRLANPWLNFGYMESVERELTWDAQKAAGKIDPHTLCLVRPPTVQPLERQFRYRRNC